MSKNSNFLIVFTGPSGVGKSSVEKFLFEDNSLNLGFSISATTRNPRINEKEAINYYFVTHDKFQENIDNDAFLEWNEHFGNRYGTLKTEIVRLKKNGKNPFVEVEVNGANNIVRQYPREKHVSIFLAPPNKEELEKRIRNRNTESETQIKKRLNRGDMELKLAKKFDYVVINDIPSRAANEIKDIINLRIGKND